MAENNHTPGPWQGCLHLRSDADEKCGCGYIGGIWSVSSDLMICEMGPSGQGSDLIPVPSRDEVKANARLIAASPELLEVVKALVSMVEHSMEGLTHKETGPFVPGVTDLSIRPDGSLRLSDARAAIAKAEGRS